MNLNLHNVTRTELSAPSQLSTGAWVRELTVTTDKGQKFTVTLFSDDRDSLLVKG